MAKRKKPKSSYLGTWDGGYIRRDSQGRDVYVIRKKVRGFKYELSTRCHESGPAHEHWTRFQADPQAYVAAMSSDPRDASEAQDGETAILMTEELAKAYLKWLLEEKHDTQKHVRTVQNSLAMWADRLDGVDLRVQPGHHQAWLRRHVVATAELKKRHVVALKAFYAWLRKVRHELETSQDPTFGTLAIKPARSAQAQGKKTVMGKGDFHEVLEVLAPKADGAYHDAVLVLGGTGWHVSELQRLLKGHGNIIETPAPVLCVQHKGGHEHRTAVTPEVLAAAKRLRQRGSLNARNLNTAITEAVAGINARRQQLHGKKAQLVPSFTVGVLRHSVATHAVEAGGGDRVPAFLGHKDKATTAKFYAGFSVPAQVPTLADES